MKYTIENVKLALEKANDAALAAAIQFRQEYPDDFGVCGFAVAEGRIGRKRKLRKILEELDVRVNSRLSAEYIIDISNPLPNYKQQNGLYPQTYKKAFIDVLNEELEINLEIHSWVD